MIKSVIKKMVSPIWRWYEVRMMHALERVAERVLAVQHAHFNQMIKTVMEVSDSNQRQIEDAFRRMFLLGQSFGAMELLAPEYRRHLVNILKSRCESKSIYFCGAKADFDFLGSALPEFRFEYLDRKVFDDVNPEKVVRSGAIVVADPVLFMQFLWRPGIGRSLGAFTKDLMVLFVEPTKFNSINLYGHNGFVIQSGDLERARRSLHASGFYQVLTPFKCSELAKDNELSKALDGFGNYTIVEDEIFEPVGELGPFIVASRISFGDFVDNEKNFEKKVDVE